MLVPIDKNISVSSDFIMTLIAIKYNSDEFSEICDKQIKKVYREYATKIAFMPKEEAISFVNKICYQEYWKLLLKGDEDYV